MRTLFFSIAALSSILFSPVAQAQTADTVPPENMLRAPTVEAVGAQHVNLSWEALKDNVGVVSYHVYYSETSYLSKSQAVDPAQQFARFKQVKEPRATIDGLTKGKKYYFTVTGLDAAGNESEYVATEAEATIGSASATAAPSASPAGATPVPGVPTPGNVIASPTPTVQPSATPRPMTETEIRDLTLALKRMADDYNVTLEWKLPPSLTGNIAQILYQGNDGSPFAKLATLLPTASSYVAEHLAPGRYEFKVSTIGPDGIESEGITASIELAATGPSLMIVGMAALAGTLAVTKRRRASAK